MCSFRGPSISWTQIDTNIFGLSWLLIQLTLLLFWSISWVARGVKVAACVIYHLLMVLIDWFIVIDMVCFLLYLMSSVFHIVMRFWRKDYSFILISNLLYWLLWVREIGIGDVISLISFEVWYQIKYMGTGGWTWVSSFNILISYHLTLFFNKSVLNDQVKVGFTTIYSLLVLQDLILMIWHVLVTWVDHWVWNASWWLQHRTRVAISARVLLLKSLNRVVVWVVIASL